MAKNALKILFNLANVAHFGFIIYFMNSLQIPGHRQNAFGGHWKFITFWNLWIQLVYFSVGLCNELCGLNPNPTNKQSSSKLQRTRDFLFSTLGLPVGFFVTVIFWSIYAMDRSLIFPKKLDEFYPHWANHMMHTTCMVSQLIELMTTFHAYPSRTKGLLSAMSFSFIYLGWILFIAYQANVWVYPILQKLSPIGRSVFIGSSSVLFGMIYLGGEVLNGKVWSLQTQKNKKEQTAANGNHDEPTHNYNTRSRKKVAKVD